VIPTELNLNQSTRIIIAYSVSHQSRCPGDKHVKLRRLSDDGLTTVFAPSATRLQSTGEPYIDPRPPDEALQRGRNERLSGGGGTVDSASWCFRDAM
jgi:hypothetical protein